MKTEEFVINENKRIEIIRDAPGNFLTKIKIVKPNIKLELVEVFNSKGEVISKVEVIHLANNTISRLKIKGVVPKESKAISHSVVNVPAGVNDCDTDLSQKFLTLHETSFAEAEPALEIEPSKVKASHSLSISPISEEDLFYLQTRGINEKDAKKQIVESFLKV